MVLFFKIDDKKKLRMLYCTNFKAQEVNPAVKPLPSSVFINLKKEEKSINKRYKVTNWSKDRKNPIVNIKSSVKILEDKVDETLCA